MKISILTFFCLIIFASSIIADPIESMEKWQAEKVASYIQSEGFIFNYCDCCNQDRLEIIQIENVSAEPVDAKLYSVRIRGKLVASFDADKIGNLKDQESLSKPFNNFISLNYTFIQLNNKLVSISNILKIKTVDGYDVLSCLPFLDIPKPSNKAIMNNLKYGEWYLKKVESVNYEKELIGSWSYLYEQKEDGEINTPPVVNQRISFRLDKTFFYTMGNGEVGKWKIEEDKLLLYNEEPSERYFYEKVQFFLSDDLLYLKLGGGTQVFKK